MKQWLDKNKNIISKVATSAAKGSAVGSIASVATGVAVMATIPAWLPFAGGAMIVSGTALATYGAVGAVVGGMTGCGLQLYKNKKTDKEWEKY